MSSIEGVSGWWQDVSSIAVCCAAMHTLRVIPSGYCKMTNLVSFIDIISLLKKTSFSYSIQTSIPPSEVRLFCLVYCIQPQSSMQSDHLVLVFLGIQSSWISIRHTSRLVWNRVHVWIFDWQHIGDGQGPFTTTRIGNSDKGCPGSLNQSNPCIVWLGSGLIKWMGTKVIISYWSGLMESWIS